MNALPTEFQVESIAYRKTRKNIFRQLTHHNKWESTIRNKNLLERKSITLLKQNAIMQRQRLPFIFFQLIIVGVNILRNDSFVLRSGTPCRDVFSSQPYRLFSFIDLMDLMRRKASTTILKSQENILAEEILSPRTIAMNNDRHEAAILACGE